MEKARSYDDELRSLAEQFRSRGVSTEFRGRGAAKFLFVTSGERGAELYRGGSESYVLDPSLGNELLGEVSFPSWGAAIGAAFQWLESGVHPGAAPSEA